MILLSQEDVQLPIFVPTENTYSQRALHHFWYWWRSRLSRLQCCTLTPKTCVAFEFATSTTFDEYWLLAEQAESFLLIRNKSTGTSTDSHIKFCDILVLGTHVGLCRE